jgi:hypothetical protein
MASAKRSIPSKIEVPVVEEVVKSEIKPPPPPPPPEEKIEVFKSIGFDANRINEMSVKWERSDLGDNEDDNFVTCISSLPLKYIIVTSNKGTIVVYVSFLQTIHSYKDIKNLDKLFALEQQS